MDTVQLRHKVTGLPVIGTFERIPGCASVQGFLRDEDGKTHPIYVGGTDVWWDNQRTEINDATGLRYFIVEGGDVVCEDECEVAED